MTPMEKIVIIMKATRSLFRRFRPIPAMPCSACGGHFTAGSKALVMDGRIVHNTVCCAMKRTVADNRLYRDITAVPYRKAVLQVLEIEAKKHMYENHCCTDRRTTMRSKIVELVMEKVEDRVLLRPKRKEDEAIFRHCSEGSVAITSEFFESSVYHLLLSHGVTRVDVL